MNALAAPGPAAPTRLRVAHVVTTSAFAGTESYVATAAVMLANRDVGVTVIGGEPGRMRAALALSRVPVSYHEAAGPGRALTLLRALAPFDIVHAHLTAAETAAVGAFPRRRGGPLVVVTRHIAAHRGSSLPGRLASIAIRHRLDGQLAPSRFVAERVDGPSTCIPTGVTCTPLGPHDQAVVIVAQRLEPEKDTATALRAWATSGLGAQGWELHLAGEGGERSTLIRLSEQLGISGSCHFLGHVDDIGERLGRASILLAPATAEPYGLSVVEAMAAGLPVVASAAGGHLETVGAVPGASLFPPGDHTAAAGRLIALADDAPMRAAYGAALQSHQRAALDVEGFADNLLAWYQILLTRSTSAVRSIRRAAAPGTGALHGN